MERVRVAFLVIVCLEALCFTNGERVNETKVSSIQPSGYGYRNFLTLAGWYKCTTLLWNASVVIISTPTIDIVANVCTFGATLPLMYNRIPLNYTFTYLPNPEIDSVEPREAIASGGIRLTVRGKNLDSVAQTILTVTRVDDDYEFQSPCEKPESTRMICLTPKLEIEDEERKRKKRDTASTTNTNKPWNPTRANIKKSQRLRRDQDQDRLQYYLGLIQDGFQEYRDLRKTQLPAYLNVTVGIPEIQGWDDVKKHKVGDSILIQGRHMTAGCSVDDYVVEVGRGRCSDLDLASTSLRCHPPKNQPEKIEIIASSEGHHVLVRVGNYGTYVGLLKYTKRKWYEDTSILAGIGAGGGLLLLVILVLLCLSCCRQKTDPNSNVQQQFQQRDTPGTNEQSASGGRIIRRLPSKDVSHLRSNSEGLDVQMYECLDVQI